MIIVPPGQPGIRLHILAAPPMQERAPETPSGPGLEPGRVLTPRATRLEAALVITAAAPAPRGLVEPLPMMEKAATPRPVSSTAEPLATGAAAQPLTTAAAQNVTPNPAGLAVPGLPIAAPEVPAFVAENARGRMMPESPKAELIPPQGGGSGGTDGSSLRHGAILLAAALALTLVLAFS